MKYMTILSTSMLFIVFVFISPTLLASSTLDIASAFSKSAQYTNMRYSPGGKYLSAKTISDGKRILVVLDAKTMGVVNAVQFESNAQVGSYVWVNDERIVFAKEYLKGWDDTPRYYGELMAVNADGSNQQYLFGYQKEIKDKSSRIKRAGPFQGTAFILDALQDDKRYMLVQALPWGGESNQAAILDNTHIVFRVDVYTGKRKKIATAPISNAQFITDHSGEVRLVKGTDKNNDEKSFYYHDGEWVNIEQLNLGLFDFIPITFTQDPNVIYAQGRETNKTAAIYSVNLTNGEKEKIIEDPTVDPKYLWIDDNSKELFAVEFQDGYPSYSFINPSNKQSATLRGLIAALPGHQVHIVSTTRDGKKWTVLAFNDRNPGDFYSLDTENMKLAFLASTHEWLDPEIMAEVKPIKFTNRDGQTIHGYLTMPHGAKLKDLPLVVNPHGGPHGVRDWWGFNPQNQMFASQGIAVLQVNFRGSGGYGNNFEVAGYQKWGSDIQHDIIDATHHLIKEGVADKNRVCIVGVSFGGYSALQSSILVPDLFKCAVGFAGVYDLVDLFKNGDVSNRFEGRSYLREVLGEDEAVLKQMSPSQHANKLKAAVLLIHGRLDERAPIEQFEAMARGLKANNHAFERLIMDDEGHGFYNDRHRAKAHHTMLEFVKEHLEIQSAGE